MSASDGHLRHRCRGITSVGRSGAPATTRNVNRQRLDLSRAKRSLDSPSGVEIVASPTPTLAAFLFAVALGRSDGPFLLTAALPVTPAVLAPIHAIGLGDGERTVN